MKYNEINVFFCDSLSSSSESQPIKASLKDVLKESDATYPHTNEDCKAEKNHDQSSAAKRGFVYHHF